MYGNYISDVGRGSVKLFSCSQRGTMTMTTIFTPVPAMTTGALRTSSSSLGGQEGRPRNNQLHFESRCQNLSNSGLFKNPKFPTLIRNPRNPSYMLIRRAHKITWPSGGTESATNFMLLSAVFWGFSCMHPKSILKRSPKSAKETALELCWKFSSQRHLPFSAGSKCAVNIMLSAAMCWAFLFQHDKNLQKRALKSIKRAPKSTKIRSRAAQKVWKLIKKNQRW